MVSVGQAYLPAWLPAQLAHLKSSAMVISSLIHQDTDKWASLAAYTEQGGSHLGDWHWERSTVTSL